MNLYKLLALVPETGSSSFELAHQVGEPLMGRKWQFYLYPIAQLEMNQLEAPYQIGRASCRERV